MGDDTKPHSKSDSGEMELPTEVRRRMPLEAMWLEGARSSSRLTSGPPASSEGWSIDSWQTKENQQALAYEDPEELEFVLAELRSLPPLVTSWEIERLRREIAEAQDGKRFLLQGGDCAEMLDRCEPNAVTAKLKILLQMSLVLTQAAGLPVIRVGRMAGQYAKPRSSTHETRAGVTLPSYFGDLVNGHAFTPEARKLDPKRLLRGYFHSAVTLNFVRSLGGGGFADLHHPEYWDLDFFERADLPPELRREYERITSRLSEAIQFMEALGEERVENLTKVHFYASHEGLHLHYEAAQTRLVPRRDWHYNLSTHLPWIGERTRSLSGAHVEFFRGLRNPIGVKVGPKMTPRELLALLDALNPRNEPGKIILISRMGAAHVADALPPLAQAVAAASRRVLWISDPMHGNTRVLPGGVKTRNFDDILLEIERTFDAHAQARTRLGGIHFELTGEDVTECVGSGVTEATLDTMYTSTCDPRLNYRQALEMAFRIAHRMTALRRGLPGP